MASPFSRRWAQPPWCGPRNDVLQRSQPGLLDGCETRVVNEPPDGLPTYRILTGPDDDQFCRRVSEALALGYRLHQGPAVTHDGTDVIVAQALMWPGL